MQNVLPRSGARAYTLSDDASADQRYTDSIGLEIKFEREGQLISSICTA